MNNTLETAMMLALYALMLAGLFAGAQEMLPEIAETLSQRLVNAANMR